MNLKNFVPSEVRLDQARHKARKAYGRNRIVVNQGASEAYRQNIERVDFSDAPWRQNHGEED